MRQLALVLACLASFGHGRRSQPAALQNWRRPITESWHLKASRAVDAQSRAGTLLNLRGGDDDPSEAFLTAMHTCNALGDYFLGHASAQVDEMRATLEKGSFVPGFGAAADLIMREALTGFDRETPADADEKTASLYQEKREELQAALLKQIEPVFSQQICVLADAVLKGFKKDLSLGFDGSKALASAEGKFVRNAGASMPRNSGFSFKFQCASLVSAMRALLAEQRRAQQAIEESTGEIATVRSYVEMQQEQMKALQSEFPTQIGWDIGAAYHPPETDFNIFYSYEPGVPEVQVSMTSEQKKDTTLLDSIGDGFTNGMGPVKLGCNVNLHL
mmetsp:Transcript_34019/g.60161  ORF Transcript_34019/g.60161 Transcript_34019/m.60161 type:complete len:332 (-) Transcript_34019:14-1009(-)